MKRILMTLAAVMATLPLAASAATLRVWTPFADMDPGAQGWEELLRSWEERTGNRAEDYSGAQDEDWMKQLQAALAAGEADVVVLPAGDSVPEGGLVSAAALAAAVPEAAAPEGADGRLIPVRWGFETLFINTDVLERYGLAVPQSWEDLVVACAVLAQAGATPVANALTEWAEIVLDCCAVIGAPAEEFGGETSLAGAQDALATLSAVGAFGSDPWNAEDEASAEAFLSGQAAMRFDSWDFALSIPAERATHVQVIALPGIDGEARTRLPGMSGCGVAVSEACRADAGRWQAACSLVSAMLSESGEAALVTSAGGKLAESMAALTLRTQGVTGTLYDANPDGFDDWAEQVISGLMSE